MNRRRFGRWLLGAPIAMRHTKAVLLGPGGITSGPRYFSARDAPPLTWRRPPGPRCYNRVRLTTDFPRAQIELSLWPDITSWGASTITVSGLSWPSTLIPIPSPRRPNRVS